MNDTNFLEHLDEFGPYINASIAVAFTLGFVLALGNNSFQ